MELARVVGWRCYHTFDSRRSGAGWPDLVLCKPPRLIVAELKSAHGRVRAEQRDWLAALGACPGVEVVLWRPGDWARIEAMLLGRADESNRPGRRQMEAVEDARAHAREKGVSEGSR